MSTDRESSSSSPWLGLPLDVGDLLLRVLTSHADRVRFAAVCRRWRYVARRYTPPWLPPALPWITFPDDGAFQSLSDGERHFFPFRERAACLGAYGRWQLYEEVAGRGPLRSRRYYMRDPLAGATVRLPGWCDVPRHVRPGCSPHGVPSVRRSSNFFVKKVIVCSDDLIVATVVYRHRSSLVVCCRPGMMSLWSRGLDNGHWYHDMALYKGKICTVTTEGHLFAHELSTKRKPRVRQIQQVIPSSQVFPSSMSSCYLVISCTGKLLMVGWNEIYEEVRLKVFEADLERNQWQELTRLDDQVLFISPNCSMAMRASRHSEYLQGNKIYFADDGLIRKCIKQPSRFKRACVYDMTSKNFRPLSLGDDISFSTSRAAWFFP